MTMDTPHGRYLYGNNPRLDVASLERRLDEILAERRVMPAAAQPLPSQQPASRPSWARRQLIRVKRSYLVSQWLPRHPLLYRRTRALYHRLKGLLRR
ncbi:MAG: hypothetical protein ACQEUN_08015 [Pseudomonadota bacterium]